MSTEKNKVPYSIVKAEFTIEGFERLEQPWHCLVPVTKGEHALLTRVRNYTLNVEALAFILDGLQVENIATLKEDWNSIIALLLLFMEDGDTELLSKTHIGSLNNVRSFLNLFSKV